MKPKSKFKKSKVKLFPISLIVSLFTLVDALKKRLVNRMFWGRGSLYRNSFQAIMFLLTVMIMLTGILNRFSVTTVSSIHANSEAYSDVFYSGGGAEAVDTSEPGNGGFGVGYHVVKDGDTLEALSAKYKISKNTIRWANLKMIGPFSEHLQVGWILKIPSIEGVLYKVKPEDSIFKIAQNTKGDVFVISEVNNIEPPEYKLPVGQEIFVPDGKLQNWGNDVTVTEASLEGAFEDPLSNPACNGYKFYGGVNSYPGHNGVDVGIAGGCPIRSIAAGTVIYSGWETRSGYTVKVDHGGGLTSYYYHGSGEIWVKKGQYVEQGTDLMMMGCTGNCFGTHLHITIKLKGNLIIPEKYIPFKYNL